jgi:4-hydroxy-tetrahydrodipicolinate synthase
MSIFTGSGTAMITPFAKGAVDFDAFAAHIEFQIAQGTRALIVVGTTGEPSTMTTAEKRSVIAFAVRQAAGRAVVIAGSGGNNTAQAVEDSLAAQELGADALLVVTPYYNKTTPKGLLAHYGAIAEAVDLPIIVYNVPGRTGLNVSPATMAELATLPHVAAVKEASGNIHQILEVRRLCPTLDLYSGSDEINLPILAAGGCGVISVASNIIPADVARLVERYLAGDTAEALALQLKINPLVTALFCETSPIPVKTAMNRMGMAAGDLRLPLVAMEPANERKLESALAAYGLI